MDKNLKMALEELRRGRPVFVFDSDEREGETDIVFASELVTWEAVRFLRKEAGGLLCMTIPFVFHSKIGLPYLNDIIQGSGRKHPILSKLIPNDIPYDAKSSFSVTVNHRETFTGITDRDRALTISALASLMIRAESLPENEAAESFGRMFRSPGHVPLLNASPGGLSERRGHTELTTALVEMAGLYPSAAICEMMDGPQGYALPKDMAYEYAAENGYVFVEGEQIIEGWSSWSG